MVAKRETVRGPRDAFPREDGPFTGTRSALLSALRSTDRCFLRSNRWAARCGKKCTRASMPVQAGRGKAGRVVTPVSPRPLCLQRGGITVSAARSTPDRARLDDGGLAGEWRRCCT
jgi:hypothetical protein